MAMMLVLTLVEPQSSGVGGGGFFLYHDAKTGQIATIDGRETAPAAATPDRFLDANGQPRGFMDVVPGGLRSEEHTSELQSLMRNSFAVFCLKKKTYYTQ